MFRVVKKQTRPSVSVNFYRTPAETAAWINENYVQTGKILNSEFSVSPNGLELTMTVNWASLADNMTWREDQYVIDNVIAHMESYCTENGIVLETVMASEIV